MTLGVTGVVWFPRTATVNATSLLGGAGAAPLVTAAAAWQSVSVAYADASITVGRVMAVLAAGWEGEAANAAHARLGAFLAWTNESAAKAAQISGLAASESAAYTAAALTMPNPVEIAAVKTAKYTAYSTGGALNGSAEALEVVDRALDVRATLVMEAYEAATTPLALHVSFDRPPSIVNDGGTGSAASDGIAATDSYSETGIFGFEARTSPAQAAVAAVGAALQNPGLAGAAGQMASTAGSVAGSSVTTVASAATNIGSAAATALTSPAGSGQPSGATPLRADMGATGPMSTRAVSTGSPFGAGGQAAGAYGGSGGLGKLAGSWGAPSGTVGDRLAGGFGAGGSGAGGVVGGFGTGHSGNGPFGAQADAAATARGSHGGAPLGGSHATNAGTGHKDEEDHETPGYLKQFEHFSDGRTVAPSVIGADPTWNDR
ncbi:MAG: PPE domain-containing protein [Rhodococcus sp. (in: high G+C Gram-positive bacteria)]